MKTIQTLKIDVQNADFEKFFVETDKYRIFVELFPISKKADSYKLTHQIKGKPGNAAATIGTIDDTMRVMAFLLDETNGEYLYFLNKYKSGNTHVTL